MGDGLAVADTGLGLELCEGVGLEERLGEGLGLELKEGEALTGDALGLGE